MEPILIILGAVVIIPLLLCLRGFVLCKLWAWFVCPIFSLAPISIPQAIGIALVVSFLAARRSSNSKKLSWGDGIDCFADPALVLALGWIIHLFL